MGWQCSWSVSSVAEHSVESFRTLPYCGRTLPSQVFLRCSCSLSFLSPACESGKLSEIGGNSPSLSGESEPLRLAVWPFERAWPVVVPGNRTRPKCSSEIPSGTGSRSSPRFWHLENAAR
ncbi:hypothetical protein AGIG_G25281 [Arapaima gigas]